MVEQQKEVVVLLKQQNQLISLLAKNSSEADQEPDKSYILNLWDQSLQKNNHALKVKVYGKTNIQTNTKQYFKTGENDRLSKYMRYEFSS